MSEFKPLSRYISLREYIPSESSEAEDNWGLSSMDFQDEGRETNTSSDRISIYKVESVGPSVSLDLKQNQLIMVEDAMVHRLTIPNINDMEVIYILENYVIGTIYDGT